ncbi:hypothetical protein KHA93_06685 [Bacillus sp. FJAT-49732]|uniref:Uncharacterized protein n=1 Tax=Lederbergia citrisecunda TaxID=2833583 RepID=A0A942TM93_9BACI|nr:hypothetical protein [Lederbergia citrisecunda]MBS4199336.1 hypothetical protein [Lederbergia citrisecunda]
MKEKFQIEFKDNHYLHKTISLDLINKPVQNMGRMWIFVVKSDDYVANRRIYGEVVREIHDRIVPFLQKEYNYEPQACLIDSEHKVY